MNKIFKYPFDPETLEVEMPQKSWILRIDHVDDGFYKGDFLWAVVDVADPRVKQRLDKYLVATVKRYNEPPAGAPRHELRVKERQIVDCGGRPIGAGEDDGRIFVYLEDFSECGPVEIAVFKTGQEIDIPIEKLRYLGLNRLWIIQELGLYTFEVLP